MSLNSTYGPGLGAEIAYRRERILDAARGSRRVRRGRTRRGARMAAVSKWFGRVGAAHPAH